MSEKAVSTESSPLIEDSKEVVQTSFELMAQKVVANKNGKYYLIAIFTCALLFFVGLMKFSPDLTPEEHVNLVRIPRGVEDLRLIHEVVEKYSEENATFTLISFCYLYIFMQSFAIPGPVFLSILSGAIFGGVKGFFIVCFCATIGASCCYGLSYTLGRSLVLSKFPSMLKKFYTKIQDNREHTFFYMLFLRLTPLVPNWFVNIASPIVGIPFHNFFLGTFIGLMPLNVIHINAGLTLSSLEKVGASFTNILWIALLGCLALIPTMLKKKIEKFDNQNSENAHKNE